mmetsp:Transcript_5735/g.13430  ORF Transcript_5735/g.13430 Transcript_5735/m.13430 type:complete len:212 (-) Transcript_5735:607-1242(-)
MQFAPSDSSRMVHKLDKNGGTFFSFKLSEALSISDIEGGTATAGAPFGVGTPSLDSSLSPPLRRCLSLLPPSELPLFPAELVSLLPLLPLLLANSPVFPFRVEEAASLFPSMRELLPLPFCSPDPSPPADDGWNTEADSVGIALTGATLLRVPNGKAPLEAGIPGAGGKELDLASPSGIPTNPDKPPSLPPKIRGAPMWLLGLGTTEFWRR